MIRLKRAYETPSPADGTRILVERLWPRGISKSAAQIDIWLKELAPTTELRKWYGHDPDRWAEFQCRYRDELEANGAAIEQLKRHLAEGDVTFVFAARDVERNSAVVLKQFAERQLKSR